MATSLRWKKCENRPVHHQKIEMKVQFPIISRRNSLRQSMDFIDFFSKTVLVWMHSYMRNHYGNFQVQVGVGLNLVIWSTYFGQLGVEVRLAALIKLLVGKGVTPFLFCTSCHRWRLVSLNSLKLQWTDEILIRSRGRTCIARIQVESEQSDRGRHWTKHIAEKGRRLCIDG